MYPCTRSKKACDFILTNNAIRVTCRYSIKDIFGEEKAAGNTFIATFRTLRATWFANRMEGTLMESAPMLLEKSSAELVRKRTHLRPDSRDLVERELACQLPFSLVYTDIYTRVCLRMLCGNAQVFFTSGRILDLKL